MSAPKGFKFPGGSKIPYRLHNPHYVPLYPTPEQMSVTYLAVDPGVTYFAYRVERRYINGRIETLIFDLVNLNDEENIYAAITMLFERHREILNTVNVVIVESQIANNYQRVRIAQHLLTYFSEIFRSSINRPPILEMNSKCKGKYLGAPKKVKDYQLKKWAIEKAEELLRMRNDVTGLNVLEANRRNANEKIKPDDLSDCILMIEAFCILHKLPLTSQQSRQPIIIFDGM